MLVAVAATGTVQAQTPAPAAPAVPAATQTLLANLYAPMCAAVENPTDKNLAAADALMAPGYVQTDEKGKQHSRDEIVATMRLQLKQIEADDCTTTFGPVTAPDASTMVVTATLHLTGSVQGQDGKHSLDATQTAADTWKLSGGTWEQTQSKSVRDLVKIDGTVVQDEGH